MSPDAAFLIDSVRGQVARAKARRVLDRHAKPAPAYKRRKLARAQVEQVRAAHVALADRFNGLRLLASVPAGGMQ